VETLSEVVAVPVTRMEILDSVEHAFAGGGADRSDVLACAVGSGARPELIETLEALPERRFNDVRDLWVELTDVPVDA
jgi:hypothetical protein